MGLSKEEKLRVTQLLRENGELSAKARNTPALALKAVLMEKDRVVNELILLMAKGVM